METWFLLYADNELSDAEKSMVDEFLNNHPEHSTAFERLQKIRFSPSEHFRFPDKSLLYSGHIETTAYTFEPDLSVVYPSKQSLYRKENRKVANELTPLLIAAGVLVLLGLFMINFSADEKIQSDTLSSIVHTPSSTPIKITSPITTTKESHLLSNQIVTASKMPMTRRNEIEVSSDKDETNPADLQLPIAEEEVIAAEPETHSNFTDEALRAAQLRNESTPTIVQQAVGINTEMLTEAMNKNENPSRIRGLVRKIGRRLFKDNEEELPRKYIHVSSFVIPVSTKK